MESLSLVPRTMRSFNSRSSQICLRCHLQQQVRTVATSRRTKKALRIAPSDAFATTTETSDHIIFNPPSSAPNVYHTPLKFLPANDPRRKLQLLITSRSPPAFSAEPDTTAPSTAARKLPPAIRPAYTKQYHLSADDVAEIKRLRTADPRTWTRVKLAEKFGCSQFFVSLCAQSPEMAVETEEFQAEIKRKWGRQKKEAREERGRRKEGWGRDE